ncbi:MAG: hypothetical protein Q9160_005734 [Pyrenula sp. 1 TL-2023]
MIPSTSSPQPRNVSYHTLQTFPEKSYGFLDLPRSEADRMKKKLNGSILKGNKISVEEARPRKRLRSESEEDRQATERPASLQKLESLSSRHPAELAGHELRSNRKVKRGWTEPKRKDRKRKASEATTEAAPSKYSEQEECLFRAKVPPNRSIANGKPSSKKEKAAKRAQMNVVHEFEKSETHPTFLRAKAAANNGPTTASFVDGKGWVDQSGALLEEHPKISSRNLDNPQKASSVKQRTLKSKPSKKLRDLQPKTSIDNEDPNIENETTSSQDTSSSSSSDDLSSARYGSDSEASIDVGDVTSSEGSLSDSDAEEVASLKSGVSPTSATANIPITSKVHPLEALFKQPQTRPSSSANKPSLEIKTSFNFFESNPEEDAEAANPTTPFTRKDMLNRGQRSAAPTPDTAAPTKASFSRSEIEPRHAATSNPSDSKIEKGGSANDTKELQAATSEGGKGESSFAKWFWENRGENNRTWKRLRREAAKEQRQKENRKSRLGR